MATRKEEISHGSPFYEGILSRDFQKDNNYFYHLLASEYDVAIDEKDPDLLFFSVDYAKTRERDKYKNHRCKKIFYTGESVSPESVRQRASASE